VEFGSGRIVEVSGGGVGAWALPFSFAES